MGVPSLTSSCGFKTPRCHELWWRLPMRLGAGTALSLVYTSSSSPDSPLPSQGSTSQDRLESPSSFSTLQSLQICSPILQEGRECLFAGLFPVLYRRVWIFFFFFFFLMFLLFSLVPLHLWVLLAFAVRATESLLTPMLLTLPQVIWVSDVRLRL